MIRVWGGGIYEPDIFYDVIILKSKFFLNFMLFYYIQLADEHGILIWEDFMFAVNLVINSNYFRVTEYYGKI